MPHARKARLFLLRTRDNVPVPIHYHGAEPRGFGCARQYLFLEKGLIEFMFLIGTRPGA